MTGAVTWEELVGAGFSGKLSDLTFSGSGGKLTFSDDTILEATPVTADQGLAITGRATVAFEVAAGKTLTFKGYDPSAATRSRGGVLTVDSGSTFTLIGTSLFTGNTVKSTSDSAFGAAIYNVGWLTLDGDTTFTGNSVASAGTYAGGAAVYNANKMTFKGAAVFKGNVSENNKQEAQGGAVHNGLSGVLTFSSVAFVDNKAINSGEYAGIGGAIINWNKVTFEGDAIFEKNMAINDSDTEIKSGSASGGAIHTRRSMKFLGAATFNENTAAITGSAMARAEGGAISATYGTLTFSGPATFTGNTASAPRAIARGGAVYNQEADVAFSHITKFDRNVAKSKAAYAAGGAIANRKKMTLSGAAIFTKNTVGSEAGSAYGGAIFNQNTLTVSGISRFTENTATSDSLDAFGGAVVNWSGSMTFEKDVSFERNAATGKSGPAFGGAIANVATMTVSGPATFTGNTATSESGAAMGGAIDNRGKITFSGDATFKNNTATSASDTARGGAICNQGGTVNLEPGADKTILFSGNTANGAANSIYLVSFASGGKNYDAVLKVGGAGTVDMRTDPMGGRALGGRAVTLVKDGTSTWWLGGENVFTADDTAGSRTDFQVKDGILAFTGGKATPTGVDLKGSTSTFTLEAPAILSLGEDSHNILVGNGGPAPAAGTGGTITLKTGSTLTFDLDATREKTAVLTLRAENVVLP
ncbi:hypothetical protein, partial [Phaeovibrio sulfidiphilus]|uniref:hypothetical protein n=1 Tax=Phaeovibrio sulfidiphilus TaxID=1220600 RepID=UPI001A7E4C1C